MSSWWLVAFTRSSIAASAQTITFRDITAQAGIHFTHNNAAFGKKWLPETMGPGCAFIDYDNDGWPDILLINGTGLARPSAIHGATTLKLYHNNHDGTFTDVTRKSGLGDLDCSGWASPSAITTMTASTTSLLRAVRPEPSVPQQWQRHFHATLPERRDFGGRTSSLTSAAWVDYDRDGKLDLCRRQLRAMDRARRSLLLARWRAQVLLHAGIVQGNFVASLSQPGRMASSKMSPRKPASPTPPRKSLGVTVFDYNNDGWPDIFVANDTQPNKLYRNLRNGRFQDEGLAAGVAFGEDGVARGAMGVDAADYDRSGRQHLIVGNFANQMLGLYHNEGNGLFVDEAPRSKVGRASFADLGFGCFFFDYDNDGWPDIFVADGHIENEIERVQKRVSYAEAPHLFRNLGNGKFDEVTSKMGAGFASPKVARGAAYADINNDGALDVLVMTNADRHIFTATRAESIRACA